MPAKKGVSSMASHAMSSTSMRLRQPGQLSEPYNTPFCTLSGRFCASASPQQNDGTMMLMLHAVAA